MGLDMYLKAGDEEIGYWRKANAIHNWFVENCQDGVDECQLTEVPRDKLLELQQIVNTVLASLTTEPGMVQNGYRGTKNGWEPIMEPGHIVTNHEVAKRLMPTLSGFFFGSTDYDNWYIDSLKETRDILKIALAMPEDTTFTYCSSW